mmetsp:Transcript_14653/g.59819  ORF Transcript_14653/g.59819 Transcript_14653/m.59819 type:complete len:274 (-) Transcript_14653:3065-3886(-)
MSTLPRTAANDEGKLRLRRGEGAQAHQARPRAEPRAGEARVRAKRGAAVRQREPRLRRRQPRRRTRVFGFFVFVLVTVRATVRVTVASGRFLGEHEPGRRPVRVAHGDVAAGIRSSVCSVCSVVNIITRGLDRAGVTREGVRVASASKVFVALVLLASSRVLLGPRPPGDAGRRDEPGLKPGLRGARSRSAAKVQRRGPLPEHVHGGRPVYILFEFESVPSLFRGLFALFVEKAHRHPRGPPRAARGPAIRAVIRGVRRPRGRRRRRRRRIGR